MAYRIGPAREVPATGDTPVCRDGAYCERCAEDRRFLRSKQFVAVGGNAPPIAAVDIFAGCGGMSVGLQEAARRVGVRLDVKLAVDHDAKIAEIYRRNADHNIKVADIRTIFDGTIGSTLTETESDLVAKTGPIDILQGGPPCQGHSDLNNHTRRDDPKNALYLSMVRAAEVLSPKVIVIENVAAVQWDVSRVVQNAIKTLELLGYLPAILRSSSSRRSAPGC